MTARLDPSHATAGALAVPVTLRRILLATDLSPVTDLATDWAFNLARQHDAALVVVSVIDPRELRLPGGGFRTRLDQVRERRETAASILVERGRRLGIPVALLVWTGDRGESIVAVAEAEEVDMVLVGAHRRGVIGRLAMGSVSEHVARNAPCPVLIVRAADDDRRRRRGSS